MTPGFSIDYFDRQFKQQVQDGALQLNPFELAALPHLRGRVLDLGCGLGNLAIAAARRGCSVLALDASAAAIAHVRLAARAEELPVDAVQVDLRNYRITDRFDTIVSIGLLMFFDCPTAFRLLGDIQRQVKVGGTAIVNVLVQGTTYMGMFDADDHCLFEPDALVDRFRLWDIVDAERREFDAPNSTRKLFSTVIARKPAARPAEP